MEAELVHNVASDAHDARAAPARHGRRVERGRPRCAIAEWLTESVPAAILAGEEHPARLRAATATSPSVAAPRDAWWRRGPLKRAS